MMVIARARRGEVIGGGVAVYGQRVVAAVAALGAVAGADAGAAENADAAAMDRDRAGEIILAGENQVAAGKLGEAGRAGNLAGENQAVLEVDPVGEGVATLAAG